ncbi:branched-chain amino acid ABC transporter permease [Halomonas sp. MCCC 1A17488]|uniref:Branched-chain amino acid ABC transporter permease n=1 Tax=Billgrantia sulfidoxydans TaxID=2733484 RepID=A0ABX7WAD3_9GAMM|nr:MULTISPECIES: AzlC family ABC transporter permease [Halomonas]MCE8018478.1 branched-chain amino acid ABC transporter permease [Halomonas sp. MCCC 1A17488]MCG3241811.1 branched-chain amino acid ABC transporter permease [Halomonas sp. MCCC 1A17488]QPP49178.1 AzlC family ABC transporter permease [Halomonas sp. SS10-MC5]QTP56512.1 branched-chain amino acid ABC transporter permease [Halomonas sulfidoxydans]
MTTSTPGARLDLAGVLAGIRRMAPLSLFVVIFGLAFGVAALSRGLSGLEAVLMSALVFAGASQFAALELWGPEIPLLPLVATTFAINARHLLMGAAIQPWLAHLPPAQRYASLVVMSDSNWAMAAADRQRGETNVGMLVGGGIALWLTWLAGTLLGVLFGSGIDEPERFGLDVIMGCFLLAMLVGGRRDLSMLLPWSAAALAALAAMAWLPPHSHVIVGALAGGLAGLLVSPGHGEREAAA